MSKKKIEQQVYRYAGDLLHEKGYISVVDLLMKMERLTDKQVNDWRLKRIPYLERVMIGNLAKMNYVLITLKKFAGEKNLKPSHTVYKSWGKGPKRVLRFSKNGKSYVEEMYSTHYLQRNVTKKGGRDYGSSGKT
ncbi:hypothetical protein [Oceanobacillus saliphilus]|uniref:hypothetical protein n=1 Tax=Oceanobacillus saliphilus TaxID=2925834 RepID=UPI00201E60CD|nr:hypothetical protein [Oceanobacillus saliphilus]